MQPDQHVHTSRIQGRKPISFTDSTTLDGHLYFHTQHVTLPDPEQHFFHFKTWLIRKDREWRGIDAEETECRRPELRDEYQRWRDALITFPSRPSRTPFPPWLPPWDVYILRSYKCCRCLVRASLTLAIMITHGPHECLTPAQYESTLPSFFFLLGDSLIYATKRSSFFTSMAGLDAIFHAQVLRPCSLNPQESVTGAFSSFCTYPGPLNIPLEVGIENPNF